MFEKVKNSCLGESPLSKGVAKPGDLLFAHVEIKSLMYKDWKNKKGKSPFSSPFDKGDEERANGISEGVYR